MPRLERRLYLCPTVYLVAHKAKSAIIHKPSSVAYEPIARLAPFVAVAASLSGSIDSELRHHLRHSTPLGKAFSIRIDQFRNALPAVEMSFEPGIGGINDPADRC